jgi:hypothetical protein
VLSELQRLLVDALRSSDPHKALAAALQRGAAQLSADERGWLANASADGLQLTRMLVRKLRLQRLLLGDADAARWCREQPEAFARAFAAYDAAVPPAALFPSEEAAAWRHHRCG